MRKELLQYDYCSHVSLSQRITFNNLEIVLANNWSWTLLYNNIMYLFRLRRNKITLNSN